MGKDQQERKVSRRAFAQSAFWGAAYGAMAPSALAEPGEPDSPAGEAHRRRARLDQMKRRLERPIYVLFDNDALADALEICAKGVGRQIWWGKNWEDFLPRSISSLISVIDRAALGREDWQCYLNVLEQVFIEEHSIIDEEDPGTERVHNPPLILVDSDPSFPDIKPEILGNASMRLYRCFPHDVSEISRVIEFEHAAQWINYLTGNFKALNIL